MAKDGKAHASQDGGSLLRRTPAETIRRKQDSILILGVRAKGRLTWADMAAAPHQASLLRTLGLSIILITTGKHGMLLADATCVLASGLRLGLLCILRHDGFTPLNTGVWEPTSGAQQPRRFKVAILERSNGCQALCIPEILRRDDMTTRSAGRLGMICSIFQLATRRRPLRRYLFVSETRIKSRSFYALSAGL